MTEPRHDHYLRSRLRPGWSYPVGQSEVDLGLQAAGLRIGRLSLFRRDLVSGRRHEGPDRLSLLKAEWDGTATQLWIYALPSERRDIAYWLTIHEALPQAYRWLADVPRRGNAWSAARHALAFFLVGHSIEVEET